MVLFVMDIEHSWKNCFLSVNGKFEFTICRDIPVYFPILGLNLWFKVVVLWTMLQKVIIIKKTRYRIYLIKGWRVNFTEFLYESKFAFSAVAS